MGSSFKEWLNVIKKLAVYDFDGTLAQSPHKPQPHEKKHGWDGKDWWGSSASLKQPFYNGEVNQEVIEAFRKDKADPQTRVVMLTGRRGVVAPEVRDVLQQNGLFGKRVMPDYHKDQKSWAHHPNDELEDSHEEYYAQDFINEPGYPTFGKKNKPDASTLAHKHFIIQHQLMNDNIEELHIWEDRADHVPHFIKLGLELRKKWANLHTVILHRVYPESNYFVQHIPIKPGTQY